MTAALWQAVLSAVLGFVVHLGNDGLKTFWKAYDNAKPVVKKVMVFVLSFIAVSVVRGFKYPGSGLGWLWFLGLVVAVGLIAGGIFRNIKRKAPADASTTVQ